MHAVYSAGLDGYVFSFCFSVYGCLDSGNLFCYVVSQVFWDLLQLKFIPVQHLRRGFIDDLFNADGKTDVGQSLILTRVLTPVDDQNASGS